MFLKVEEQAIVMLYPRNINQTWHGGMVRYLEDAYTMGNDIYPTSLPDAYRFLDNWKTHHHVRGAFAGRGEGLTLANARDQEQDGKRDPRFVVPGKENVLCWDCGYYKHRQGNKLCPNCNPSKRSKNCRSGDNIKREEQTNATGDKELSSTAEAPKEDTRGQESSTLSIT